MIANRLPPFVGIVNLGYEAMSAHELDDLVVDVCASAIGVAHIPASGHPRGSRSVAAGTAPLEASHACPSASRPIGAGHALIHNARLMSLTTDFSKPLTEAPMAAT